MVAVRRRGEILENNFLASPCLCAPYDHQILIQEDFSCAAKAYNDAIDKSVNDLMVFCHQDLLLPEAWLSQLEQALNYLQGNDPKWGVLGSIGRCQDGGTRGHVFSSGRGVIRMTCDRPEPIQTLDEIVLILRKSSGLRFDDRLPHFHLYGADICLRAAKMGMKSYAIPAFCIHNTHQNFILAPEFYECCKHIKRVWKDSLPIQTTCGRITRFNVTLYIQRAREFYMKHIRRKEFGGTRTKDVQRLLQEFGATSDDSELGSYNSRTISSAAQ